MDFETRSLVSIKTKGAWIYSRHPSTQILCLSYLLPGDKQPSLYHTGYGNIPANPKILRRLFEWIEAGGLVEAHNSTFERYIWRNIFSLPKDNNNKRGHDAPEIKMHQWRCSAAKAAAWALPRDLENACLAAKVTQKKDTDGAKIMKKLCVSKRDGTFNEDPELFPILFDYCNQDVMAEHALSAAIPDLSDFEQQVWEADQEANERGIKIDVELCEAAIKLERDVKRQLNAKLFELTGIESGTKRKDLMNWFNDQGCNIDNTAKITLQNIKGNKTVMDVAALAIDLNRTSIGKYKKALELVDPEDDRIRDLVIYSGALTRRWAGKGVQIQNYPRGELKISMEAACNLIKRHYS